MSNMDLWSSVEKTPPSETKPITGKPYKGNSPKPHYIVRKATETFGPCGIGWGFSVTERIEDGAPGDKLHIAHVRVWYIWNGVRGEIEHIGQTMFAGKNKNGPYTDEDAPKKSVTDGLIKALSMIGFAGDIFSGRYDDSKYVTELQNEERQATSAKPPPPPPQHSKPLSAVLVAAMDALDLAETQSDVTDFMDDFVIRNAQGVNHPDFQAIRAYAAKRFKALLKAMEQAA